MPLTRKAPRTWDQSIAVLAVVADPVGAPPTKTPCCISVPPPGGTGPPTPASMISIPLTSGLFARWTKLMSTVPSLVIVNCRIVPTSTLEAVKATLERVVNDTTIKITLMRESREKFGVAPDPIEPTLLASATQLTKQTWGDIPVIPTMSTGATDGRFLRAVGIPTYGVSGIFSVPGENNAHGRDEKMRTKSYYDGLDFLYQLVKQVSGTIAM